VGIPDASYCCGFACIVPYHHGYRWPTNFQFGVRGDAYVPFRRQHAIEQGEWPRYVGVPLDGQWGPQTSAGLQQSLNAGTF